MKALQERIGYVFKNCELLKEALTHPSFLQENPDSGESNQRLEFLGDALLQLVIAEALFLKYPHEREGELSKKRAVLTKGASLANLARRIGLDGLLRMGLGEEQSGGRNRQAALEDVFEALVGAVFLDGGFETSRKIVMGIYGDIGGELERALVQENPKGSLQEKIQPLHGNNAIHYETVHVSGEDHAREYKAQVFLNGKLLGEGMGSSKKLAEEAAARIALGKVLE